MEKLLLIVSFALLKKIGNLEDNHGTGAVFLDPVEAFILIQYATILNKT